MKKRRRSRATRAKISRGLKRYYKGKRAARAKRSRAARLGWQKRQIVRGARKVRRAEKQRRAKEFVGEDLGPESRMETWEVTVKYEKSGQVVDLTVRVRAPAGATADEVRGAVWVVAKGVQLTTMQVEAMDWRRTAHGKDYTGESTQVADLKNFRGMMFHSLLRTAKVEE